LWRSVRRAAPQQRRWRLAWLQVGSSGGRVLLVAVAVAGFVLGEFWSSRASSCPASPGLVASCSLALLLGPLCAAGVVRWAGALVWAGAPVCWRPSSPVAPVQCFSVAALGVVAVGGFRAPCGGGFPHRHFMQAWRDSLAAGKSPAPAALPADSIDIFRAPSENLSSGFRVDVAVF
jgi:hypothetical protein